MLQPELSRNPGSLGLPVKNNWLTGPTEAALPDPSDGIVVPVRVFASAGLLLKSHCATMIIEAARDGSGNMAKEESKTRHNELVAWWIMVKRQLDLTLDREEALLRIM